MPSCGDYSAGQLRLTNAETALAAQQVRLDLIARTVNSKKHAKAIAGWALARVIDRDRTYARGG